MHARKVLTVSAEKVVQKRPGIGFFVGGSDQLKNRAKPSIQVGIKVIIPTEKI